MSGRFGGDLPLPPQQAESVSQKRILERVSIYLDRSRATTN
jgi:hypothetical protein